MSSAPREYSRRPPGVATSCTRMPSHFHSARHAGGIERGKLRRQDGCASIGGRNTGAPAGSGRGARPSSQANSGR